MRRLRSDAGQAFVEFVLLFPFVLILILVIVEFGFALHSFVTVNNAASEAARFAAVANLPSGFALTENPPCDAGYLSIEDRAVNVSAGLVNCDEVFVRYQKPVAGIPYTRLDGVSVFIAHSYETITPLAELMSVLSFGAIPAPPWTMSACSDARLEARPAVQGVLVDGPNCGGS
jgi:hypothetical protein